MGRRCDEKREKRAQILFGNRFFSGFKQVSEFAHYPAFFVSILVAKRWRRKEFQAILCRVFISLRERAASLVKIILYKLSEKNLHNSDSLAPNLAQYTTSSETQGFNGEGGRKEMGARKTRKRRGEGEGKENSPPPFPSLPLPSPSSCFLPVSLPFWSPGFPNHVNDNKFFINLLMFSTILWSPRDLTISLSLG